jgi:hypothetical protein
MDLLAVHPDSRKLRAAAQGVALQLHLFYGRLPDMLDTAELDRRSRAAVEALQRSFARLRRASDLPAPATAVFAAGAALGRSPDPRQTPHAIIPGDDPYARLWNALFGLRARYAEGRAILAAVQGNTAEAIDLLEREIIHCADAPSHPAADVMSAFEALSGGLGDISTADRDRLLADMLQLLELTKSAHLLQFAHASRPQQWEEIGPQLHRLLLVLEILQLCRAADIPLAALDSLAPSVLAARIDQALTATAEHRRSA